MSGETTSLTAWGRLVESPTWELRDLTRMRQTDLRCAMTCKERPAPAIHDWAGVSTRDLLRRLLPSHDATFVMVHGEGDYRAILPLARFAARDAVFALSRDGERLTVDRGGPVRLIVPGHSRCDSVKGARGLEFLAKFWPGTREMDL